MVAKLVSIPKKPSDHKRKRATQLERANRIRVAQELLEKRYVRADIVPKLQRDYEISRATANRIVDDADVKRTNESHLHWIEDPEPLTGEDSQALLIEARQMMMEASAEYCKDKDPAQAQTFVRLAIGYERLARLGGASYTHKSVS